VPLTVQRVTRGRDFAALRPLWTALAAEASTSSPFLDFDWVWCCWHAVWPHQHPEVLIFEEHGRPVAIVPLMAWKAPLGGLPARHLGLLQYLDRPGFDILSVLGCESVIPAFLTHLLSRSDWDVLHLRALPASSPVLQVFERSSAGRLATHRASRQFWASLRLAPKDRDAHAPTEGAAPPSHRALCDDAPGDVGLEEHRLVDPDSVVLREIDTTLRYPIGDASGGGRPSSRLFHFLRELVRRSGRHHDIRLWLLRRNGRVAAAECQLVSRGRVHTLSVEVNGAPELLPVLNRAIVLALHGRDEIAEYDMGPGLAEYKLSWSPDVRESIDLRLYRRHGYARLLYALEKAVMPALSRWRQPAC
jgi:hypothetical protein